MEHNICTLENTKANNDKKHNNTSRDDSFTKETFRTDFRHLHLDIPSSLNDSFFYDEQKFTNNNIRQDNINSFKLLEKCKSIINKYLSLLCNEYDYELPNTQTNKTTCDIVKKIVNNPNKIKTSNLFSKKIKNDIINAAMTYQTHRDSIIIMNDPLILNHIKSHKRLLMNPNICMDDLVQLGRLTLIKCVDTYDLKYGREFSTFVITSLNFEFYKFLSKIKIIHPVSKETVARISKVKKFRTQQELSLTVKEIAKKLNTKEHYVKRFIDADIKVSFLSHLASLKNKDNSNTDDIIPDISHDPSKIVTDNELQYKKSLFIPIILQELDDRERDVLFLRYGMANDDISMVYREIGQKYSITCTRAMQIEQNALRKIRTKFIEHPNLLKQAKELFFSDDCDIDFKHNRKNLVTTSDNQNEIAPFTQNDLSILMKGLDEREQFVINMQYDLNNQHLSLEKIAEKYSITKGRMKKIKKKALEKIKTNTLNHPKLHEIAMEVFFNH